MSKLIAIGIVIGFLAAGLLANNHTSAAAAPTAKKTLTLFKTTCATCHGNTGKGDGPAAKALKPKPRDLSSKAIMSKISDQRIFDTIKKGGLAMRKSPLMPAFTHLKPHEIKALVAHIRTLCKCSAVKAKK